MKALPIISRGLTPVILVGALAALGAWILRISIVNRVQAEEAAEQMAVATVPVTKGEFAVVVQAMGRVEAVNSKPVVAGVTGQIVYLVPNGVEVKEGDVIAELDVPRMLRRLRDQEREYQQALDEYENKKRDLEADVEKARIAREKAESELEQYQAQQAVELAETRSRKEQDRIALETTRKRFERQSALAEEGLVPRREVELGESELKAKEYALERVTKELELAEARKSAEELDKKAAVAEAESELERAKSKQEAEIREASTALEIRKTQLARVEDEFSKSVIRSPAAGIIVLQEHWQGRGMQRRAVQPGDRVWEGRPIAAVPDLSEMRVELELPQEEARLVEAKQPAIIEIEALPELSFEGEVTEVSQTANESTLPGTGMPSGERTFQAKVSIEELKGAALRPGTTARVTIVVEKLSDVLSVPLECVFNREDRHVVYVRRDGEFRALEVKLGEQNEDAAIITAGLEGGEQIALRDVGAPTVLPQKAAEEAPPPAPLLQGAGE